MEVSNVVLGVDGTWKRVRSLGGPLALDWLSQHQAGNPNTTARWTNGTTVTPSEAGNLVPLSKRWGWTDGNLELLTWSNAYFRVGDAGFQAGFTDNTASAVYGAIYSWLHDGPATGGYTIIGGNNSPDNHFEPNIYYAHSITKKIDDGDWPVVGDMNNAAHSAMQDMANNNYQGACYAGMVHYEYTGGSCLYQEFATIQFCSWKDGGSCTSPGCAWSLGEGGGNCNTGGQVIG